MDEFNEAVRREISSVLSRKYRTNRRGAHLSDRGEFLRERDFWPDMRFLDVVPYETADGGGGLAITFAPASEPRDRYGFKIDMATSLESWCKRIGIRNPREHPAMFAAELTWYMVAYIGAIDINSFVADGSGIRWINKGYEIFVKLPQGAESV